MFEKLSVCKIVISYRNSKFLVTVFGWEPEPVTPISNRLGGACHPNFEIDWVAKGQKRLKRPNFGRFAPKIQLFPKLLVWLATPNLASLSGTKR